MKKLFLNNFVLKVIAIITMTLDHIGTFMMMWAMENEVLMQAGLVLKYIGRLSMPLFVFLAVEGALKTKNVGKYILRLSYICIPIVLAQIVGEIVTQTTEMNYSFPFGNIFITLILIVTMIYCFQQKKLWINLLGTLPIIVSIIAFFVQGIETSQKIIIWWFPYMIRPQYDILAIALALAFYLSHKLIKVIYTAFSMSPELYENSENYQFGTNALQVLGLVIVSFAYYSIEFIAPSFIYWANNVQIFAILAGLLILFYNGRRGYNAKWFNITAYLYYPLHIVVIYFIFLLIFM